MRAYAVRRLLLVVPTVVGAVSLLFLLFFLLPGDPVRLIAGGADRPVDAGTRARVEERYGLDQSVPAQFVDYWGRTLRWDLGESYRDRQPVNEIVGNRGMASVRLAFWAIVIEAVIGIGVGVVAAVRRRSFTDRTVTVMTALVAALPVFVLGYLLQYFVVVLPSQHDLPEALRLRTQGIGPDSWFLGVIPTGDQWRYLLLPALTLASVSTAFTARLVRTSLLDVLPAAFVRTARAKGLGEGQVVVRHALRNALLPVVTFLGVDFGTMLGAAVLTEKVFGWPGMGSAIADSVAGRDLPVLLGLTLVVVIAYAVVNLAVDLSYGWLDPRVRLHGRGQR